MKINVALLVALMALILSLPFQATAAEIKTDKQKFSYAVGFQIAKSIKRDDLKVDIDALVDAIKAVLKDSKLKMTTKQNSSRGRQADSAERSTKKEKYCL